VRNGLKPGDYTLLPVGAGNTFIAAMKQDQIQAGMTTEPTISRLLKTGEAAVLVDMRTIVIVGSSTTRTFVDGEGRRWVYTPRDYPA